MRRSLTSSLGVATPIRQKAIFSYAGSDPRWLYIVRMAVKKSSVYGSLRVASISSTKITTGESFEANNLRAEEFQQSLIGRPRLVFPPLGDVRVDPQIPDDLAQESLVPLGGRGRRAEFAGDVDRGDANSPLLQPQGRLHHDAGFPHLP